jgi:type IV secretory pathway component VirB8
MSRGFWVAQFITMDYYPNEQTPIINIWRAYIRTILAPINYENRSLREKNPFGFLVTNYSLSYIGTPEDPQSYLETAKEVRAESYEY